MDTLSPTGAAASSWREMKIYDRERVPRNWNELLAPSQCAVFLTRVNSTQPLTSFGELVAHLHDATFLLFDRLEDARHFCEEQVERYPQMSCQIFDSAGKARPPILTIVHPSLAEKDELSASSVRMRKIIAIALWVLAAGLILWDKHARSVLVLPTVLGLNFFVIGLRLFFWNTARKDRLAEQEKRIQEHLVLEQQADTKLLTTS
jgi:hypothetical protein